MLGKREGAKWGVETGTGAAADRPAHIDGPVVQHQRPLANLRHPICAVSANKHATLYIKEPWLSEAPRSVQKGKRHVKWNLLLVRTSGLRFLLAVTQANLRPHCRAGEGGHPGSHLSAQVPDETRATSQTASGIRNGSRRAYWVWAFLIRSVLSGITSGRFALLLFTEGYQPKFGCRVNARIVKVNLVGVAEHGRRWRRGRYAAGCTSGGAQHKLG